MLQQAFQCLGVATGNHQFKGVQVALKNLGLRQQLFAVGNQNIAPDLGVTGGKLRKEKSLLGRITGPKGLSLAITAGWGFGVMAGVGVDDVAHLHLYSCFAPSVDFARDALGLDSSDTRSLTVTGGLLYFGGAGSEYMTHSIATMAATLQADPGSFGLVSGVGMHMTKHVYGIYSTEPGPLAPPNAARLQAELDATGAVPIADTYAGPATVAAYSIAHNQTEAEYGVAIVDLPGSDTRVRQDHRQRLDCRRRGRGRGADRPPGTPQH